MKQVISILLLWIGVLSCQSEDINIYTPLIPQHYYKIFFLST